MENIRYIPVSPDGFPFSPDEDFATEQEALDEIKRIIPLRYGPQGYYSKSNRDRISLDEAIAQSSVTSYNAEEYEDD
jgi:hypothetical protein